MSVKAKVKRKEEQKHCLKGKVVSEIHRIHKQDFE